MPCCGCYFVEENTKVCFIDFYISFIHVKIRFDLCSTKKKRKKKILHLTEREI